MHFGILKMTERAPRLLISPLAPNWGRPLQRGLEICTSHLGFSLVAPCPRVAGPVCSAQATLKVRPEGLKRRHNPLIGVARQGLRRGFWGTLGGANELRGVDSTRQQVLSYGVAVADSSHT